MSDLAKIHGPLSFGSLTGFDTGTQHITPVAKSLFLCRADFTVSSGFSGSCMGDNPAWADPGFLRKVTYSKYLWVSDLISSRDVSSGFWDAIARSASAAFNHNGEPANCSSNGSNGGVSFRSFDDFTGSTLTDVSASGLSFTGTLSLSEYYDSYSTDYGGCHYEFGYDILYFIDLIPLCQFKTGW